MRIRYSTTSPSQSEFDSLPRLPITLHHNNQSIETIGLVDSGATVNVLPHNIGIELGADWDDPKANLRLAGNIGNFAAMPLFVMANVGDYAPVKLAFAWVKSNDAPLILGQMNFFVEFTVCFYRSELEFEITPK